MSKEDLALKQDVEILTYLQESRLFSHLSEQLLKMIVPLSNILKFYAGDKILEEGNDNNAVYFIMRGEVDIYKEGEYILSLKRKGDIFGEMSIISDKPCSATVIARTKMDVFAIQGKNIKKYQDIQTDQLDSVLYCLFSAILSEKLTLTTHKAKQFEKTNRKLQQIQAELKISNNKLLEENQRMKDAELNISKLIKAVEQSPVSIVITDRDANIEYVNPKFTEVTGYHPEEVLGENPRVLKAEEFPEEIYQELWNQLIKGKTWKGEFLNKKKNGNRFWEKTTISPIVDNNKITTHYVAVKEDITLQKIRQKELKVAKENAEAANQAKINFLETMSHELRTPLNGIMGIAQLLLEGKRSEETRNFSKIILQSGNSLSIILNNIMEISRLETCKIEPKKICFDLHKLMEDVVHLFFGSTIAKDLSLNIKFDPQIASALIGDPDLLMEILTNLIANAVKFTEEGSISVEVSLIIEDDKSQTVQIAVSDTGIGIDIKKQAMIFEIFTQVDNSSTRSYGGAGLGLGISARLVNLLGGKIKVESEQGKGSRFDFILKLGRTAEKPKTLDYSKRIEFIHNEIAPNNFKKLTWKCLVVEDDRINQMVIVKMLENLGFVVEAASNGQIALNMLQDKKYDIVFMDCLMPIMDGYVTTQNIRKLEIKSIEIDNANKIKYIPIIALTAKSTKVDKDKCLNSGMDDYLTKPILQSSLQSIIVKWLV